jgi:hypothetical protein
MCSPLATLRNKISIDSVHFLRLGGSIFCENVKFTKFDKNMGDEEF